VDLNNNELILCNNSKNPEKFTLSPGEIQASSMDFFLSLSVTLNCMNSTEPITINRIESGFAVLEIFTCGIIN
jgi:hypothetical protein